MRVVMVTSDVTKNMRDLLLEVFSEVVDVNVLDSKDPVNLALMQRPDLGVTFTKIHCWRLTQFSKCVFMDADTLVLHNIDDLFGREEFSACADVGWPDIFNSGVFVYRPSEETYAKLLDFAISKGSFDGGDQGLLNLFFNDWSTKDISRRLPFIYNVVTQASHMYQPAFKQFGQNTKVLHFIGPKKPWDYCYNKNTNEVVLDKYSSEHASRFLAQWWNVFAGKIMAGFDHAFEVAPSDGIYKIKPELRNRQLKRISSADYDKDDVTM